VQDQSSVVPETMQALRAWVCSLDDDTVPDNANRYIVVTRRPRVLLLFSRLMEFAGNFLVVSFNFTSGQILNKFKPASFEYSQREINAPGAAA
jgi:hypothetical protein